MRNPRRHFFLRERGEHRGAALVEIQQRGSRQDARQDVARLFLACSCATRVVKGGRREKEAEEGGREVCECVCVSVCVWMCVCEGRVQ